MPDLNKRSAEELVQLDDTGPEVDIEIDEESTLPITPKQPEKPLLDDALVEPEVVVQEESEHEEYSKGVKKRIDKLTGKLREAERREQAATAYAQNVQTENKTLQQQKTNLDGNYIIAEANRITAETEATKNILRKANEEADVDTQTNAQQKLAALAVEAQRVQALNQERSAKTGQVAAPQQFNQEVQRQPAPQPEPDPKAQSWAEDNPWFGNDRAMTMTSFVIHQDLMNEGFDATSNEYYSEVNKRIRDDFPDKFDREITQTNRPAQAVAPAKRSAKAGRKTVRLTPSQVAIANKLGVPLEEYAKYVE
jgi:DNA polymerase III gamma/tau subunit